MQIYITNIRVLENKKINIYIYIFLYFLKFNILFFYFSSISILFLGVFFFFSIRQYFIYFLYNIVIKYSRSKQIIGLVLSLLFVLSFYFCYSIYYASKHHYEKKHLYMLQSIITKRKICRYNA